MGRELLSLVFRDTRSIVAAFLLPIVAGVLIVLLLPHVYEAKARLIVLLSSEYTLSPTQTATSNVVTLDSAQIINTELAVLSSEPLRRETVQSIGIDRLYPPSGGNSWWSRLREALSPGSGVSDAQRRNLDLAERRFGTALAITPASDSNVINLSFRHQDPQLAADTLNSLLDHYLEYRQSVLIREDPSFFAQQRDAMKARLEEINGQIKAFQDKHSVSDLKDQIQVLLREQSDLQSKLAQTESDLGSTKARLAGVQETLTQTKPEILLYSETSRLSALETPKSTLLHLKVRRDELLNRYKPESQTVGDIDREIDTVNTFITREKPNQSNLSRTGRNPVYEILERLNVELSDDERGLTAQRAALAASLTQVADQISSLSRVDTDYQDLLRERDVYDDGFRTYSKRLEEAKIQRELSRAATANVRVIERATAPVAPLSRIPIVLGASLLLGILAALLTAYARAATTDIFITPEAVERRLGLRVLLALPYETGRGAQLRGDL